MEFKHKFFVLGITDSQGFLLSLELVDAGLEVKLLPTVAIKIELGRPKVFNLLFVGGLEVVHLYLALLKFDGTLSKITLQCLILVNLLLQRLF